MKRLFLLTGEGIECEKESRRFFKLSESFTEIIDFCIPKVFSGAPNPLNEATAGDWLFLPGGFSFADHFGAGRLLAHQLEELAVFKLVLEKGVHVLGVCNGFQTLVASSTFGSNVRLLENRVAGKRLGFINRWCQLKTPEAFGGEDFVLPVRHGEGRIFFESESELDEGVTTFLKYADDRFENGSQDAIAGLHVQKEKSHFWGMMPHPEIALTPLSNPNVVGAEYFERFRAKTRELTGDGFRLWKAIVKKSEGEL